MDRVDHHAREAGGVEQAFFQIELPSSHLLGHQPALQAVGEPADDALEAGELLVQMVAQAREFVCVAKLVRMHDLVEFGCPGEVGRPGIVVAAVHRVFLRRGPAGFLVAHARHDLRIGVVGAGLAGIFPFGIGHVRSIGHQRAVALALRPVALAVLGRIVDILLRSLLLARGGVVEQFEVFHQAAGQGRKRLLVMDLACQIGEGVCGTPIEPIPPQVEHAGRHGRSSVSAKGFASVESDGFRQRHVICRRGAREALPAATLIDRRGQVARRARHVARAPGFHPRLLQRIEYGARLRATPRQPGMHRRVVMALAQGQGIGLAADEGGLGGGQVAPRHWQLGVAALQ